MSNSRKAVALVGASLALLAITHPTAHVRLMTHDIGDPTPHRMLAAVDLGLVGVSVLYTWTAQRLR